MPTFSSGKKKLRLSAGLVEVDRVREPAQGDDEPVSGCGQAGENQARQVIGNTRRRRRVEELAQILPREEQPDTDLRRWTSPAAI
jgi:hypothetical protein